MVHISKYICMTVIICFTFSVSAGAMAQCFDMPQQNDIPLDSDMSDCHSDIANNDESNSCCIDMNSCHTTSLFLEDTLSNSTQTQHQHVQLPLYEGTLLNAKSPPTPPPKVTS